MLCAQLILCASTRPFHQVIPPPASCFSGKFNQRSIPFDYTAMAPRKMTMLRTEYQALSNGSYPAGVDSHVSACLDVAHISMHTFDCSHILSKQCMITIVTVCEPHSVIAATRGVHVRTRTRRYSIMCCVNLHFEKPALAPLGLAENSEKRC